MKNYTIRLETDLNGLITLNNVKAKDKAEVARKVFEIFPKEQGTVINEIVSDTEFHDFIEDLGYIDNTVLKQHYKQIQHTDPKS